MENIKKILRIVDRKCETNCMNTEDCNSRLEELPMGTEYDEEREEIHDDLTELEYESNNLDEDWVFLTECQTAGKILDVGKYNGLKGIYLKSKL